jgi:predicted RNA-binding protein
MIIPIECQADIYRADQGVILSEADMCLSTVYMDFGNEQEEIMKDVARIEAEGRGFWLINLFGEKRFIEGAIQIVSLMDGHFVTLKNQEKT